MKYIGLIFAIALIAVVAYTFQVYPIEIAALEVVCLALYSIFLACSGVE